MHSGAIDWNDSLLVGHDAIDTQHKHLFEVFERLSRCAGTGDKSAETAACISELMKYVEVHFRDEEAHMQKIGFGDIAAHKVLHQEFMAKVQDYVDACGSGYYPYADMVEFLVSWLTEHIEVQDKKITA